MTEEKLDECLEELYNSYPNVSINTYEGGSEIRLDLLLFGIRISRYTYRYTNDDPHGYKFYDDMNNGLVRRMWERFINRLSVESKQAIVNGPYEDRVETIRGNAY